MSMVFETNVLTNRGGRIVNEDYAGHLVLEDRRFGCWVVADGLGGHGGGETASKTVVDVILNYFESRPGCSPECLTRYLEAAQTELLRLQKENHKLSRMRTTVVILVTDFHNVLWGHVGDSRLYYLADGIIVFQTLDHSVPQSMAAAGDISPHQIRNHEDRNRLLRTMGQTDSLRPQVYREKQNLYHGDAFLLCSDGFWEFVEENEMEIDFAKAATPAQWLEKMENRILRRAPDDFDNYTALAVFVNHPTNPRPIQPGFSPPAHGVATIPATHPAEPADEPPSGTAPIGKKSRLPLFLSLIVIITALAVLVLVLLTPNQPEPVTPGPEQPVRLTSLELDNTGVEQTVPPGFYMIPISSIPPKVAVKGAGPERTTILVTLSPPCFPFNPHLPWTSFEDRILLYNRTKMLGRQIKYCRLILTTPDGEILYALPYNGLDDSNRLSEALNILKNVSMQPPEEGHE